MRIFLGAIAAFAALTGPAEAQETAPRSAPFALALEAAEAALAACAAHGWHVTAVVLDAYGEEQIVLRDKQPYTANDTEQARRKAYTALDGQPSAAMLTLMDKDPNAYARDAYVNPRITPQAGGLPIKIGAVTVAALGVTGSPATNGVRGGLNDETCAAAGIAKIKDRLH